MSTEFSSNFRNIPKMDEFLNDQRLTAFGKYMSRAKLSDFLRVSIDECRMNLKNADQTYTRQELYGQILQATLICLEKEVSEFLKPVINATGIIIHTNMGRAPISVKAAQKVFDIATNYNNLEYSTETDVRRNRLLNIEKILIDLTGAEAALLVNNNAAAVFLALNSIAKDKPVILSRGEMVEIGESFRISEIIENSSCIVKEVGTTNCTTIFDYEKAITEESALFLKVHTSNYKVIGFTKEVTSQELVELGNNHNIPVMEDMGSGILFDLSEYGYPKERQVKDAVLDGVDIITFSGDKMLGSSQAGIIVGKKKYIDRMKKNQLMRCLRLDKLCLTALEATLCQYFTDKTEIPIIKSMSLDFETVQTRAELLRDKIKEQCPDLDIEVTEHEAQFGGGSLPFEIIKSMAVSIKSNLFSSNAINDFLLASEKPIVAQIKKEQVLLDVRTIGEHDFETIATVLSKLIK